MICPNCGTQNEAGRAACSSCGTPLAPEPAPISGAASQMPPPPGAPPGPGYLPPPPPVAYPPAGGPPPGGPKRGTSSLLAALMGFAVVAVVGGLLFFLVLKPKPPTPQPPVPPTTPGPVVTTPTTPVTTPPPPPITTPPPTQPPPSGGTINVQLNFCTAIGAGGSCQHPGFVQPASGPQFVLRVSFTNAPAGSKVHLELVNPDTGQAFVRPADLKLNGQPDCQTSAGEQAQCVTYTITGGPFTAGTRVEAQVSFDGSLLKFGTPPILTLR